MPETLQTIYSSKTAPIEGQYVVKGYIKVHLYQHEMCGGITGLGLVLDFIDILQI